MHASVIAIYLVGPFSGGGSIPGIFSELSKLNYNKFGDSTEKSSMFNKFVSDFR